MRSGCVGLVRLLVVILAIAIASALLTGCSLGPIGLATPAPTDAQVALASPTSPPTDAPAQDKPTAAPTEAAIPTPAPTPAPTLFIWLPSGDPAPPTTLPDPTSAPIPLPTAPPARPTVEPTAQPTNEPSSGGPLIPVATGNGRPTRIVVPALNIDLPIIKGDPAYPKCNVAQYMDAYDFVNPGHAGTTYLYGHARKGMFLPLLTQSKINNGANMIGMTVRVYTKDLKLHVYVINIVKRHATNFSLATNLKPGQHRLIMQTSEGPTGTLPKLQVAAKPVGVYKATAAAALPTPHPVRCN